jgi:phospholipase C
MPNPQPVVVIAFENRSFDHMLGFAPPGGKLTGQESNPVDPATPSSERVLVNQLAPPITGADPSHSFEGVREQLFGASLGQPDPAPMNGFVSNYIKDVGGDIAKGKAIMECYAPQSLPILTGLARHFCVCTRWFASVPGPTWPNRFYMHAATSRGLVTNDPLDAGALSIYDKLDGKQSWRIYAGDVPQCLSIERLAARFVVDHLKPQADRHFQPLAQYFKDLQAGTLPAYSFIEPQYFDTPFGRASDEHPPHDVRLGEALLGHVYNALRQSSYWQNSVLLVLFDEHGGFFDSIPPPTGVVAPDDLVSVQPVFDFKRLGVRVPAVLVSPLVQPGSVDATQYDHASIPATVNAVFGLGANHFLTRRDAAANTFDRNFVAPVAQLLPDVFQADTSSGPPLEALAPPDATVAGTSTALEAVLRQTTQSTLATLSSHQRRLVELSDSMLKSLR